jgi:hypothetical protein
MVANSWFVGALLLFTSAVSADDKLGPDIESAQPEKQLMPVLSGKMQALLSEITTPEQALLKGKDYQHNGQFGLAKLVLSQGIALAKSSGENYSELTDELTYKLPLLQAKELLVMGMPDEARPILISLSSQFKSDSARINEIEGLQSALVQSRFLASARRDNEAEVSRDVRSRMGQYYRKHGYFPSYPELNKLLPAGDRLLQNYEIIYFKSVPNAYRVVLRNLHDKNNLLKIEATGLMK